MIAKIIVCCILALLLHAQAQELSPDSGSPVSAEPMFESAPVSVSEVAWAQLTPEQLEKLDPFEFSRMNSTNLSDISDTVRFFFPLDSILSTCRVKFASDLKVTHNRIDNRCNFCISGRCNRSSRLLRLSRRPICCNATTSFCRPHRTMYFAYNTSSLVSSFSSEVVKYHGRSLPRFQKRFVDSAATSVHVTSQTNPSPSTSSPYMWWFHS